MMGISINSEIWVDIKGYNNEYQISNKGRIKRKSHIQTFTTHIYTNEGVKEVLAKRRYNERIISPKIVRGELIVEFYNRDKVNIKELINKYFK